MRAAAYARYSTALQKETSIAAQLRGIAAYCDEHDIDIVDTFVDEAQTGTNTLRGGFARLLASAEAGEIDAVVIYDVTRGSRDVVDWFSFRKKMRELSVRVISVTENLGDISDPNTFLTELITVGVGQHQVLQSRQKSLAAKVIRAERGLFCGGIPPLGYDIRDGLYTVNEREAQAVRHIFSRYAAGASYAHIIAELKAQGYCGKRGKTIGTNSLYSVLNNDRYIGTFSHNRRVMRYMHKWVGKDNPHPIEIPGVIPAIVDTITWRRVRKRMEQNKKNTVNKSRVGRQYLLSGLIVCQQCGAAMVGVTTTSAKGYEYKFYTCGNKRRTRTCDSRNIPANEIEPLIVATLTDSILHGDAVEQYVDAMIGATGGRGKAEIKKEIAALDIKIGNLMRSLETGLDSQTVRDRLAEHEARRIVLLAEMKKSVHTAINRADLIAQLRNDADRLSDPKTLPEIIRKYIVKVEVGEEQVIIHSVADLNTVGSPGRV